MIKTLYQNKWPKWNNTSFFYLALLLSARNNINLRKISYVLQTNRCRLSWHASQSWEKPGFKKK